MYKPILRISYLTKSLVIFLVLCVAITITAQDTIVSYSSHDGAVQFEYSSSWDLETQGFVFDTRYYYVLMNPPRIPMNLYFDSESRGRIILEVIKDTDDTLIEPVDYVANALDNYTLIEEVQVGGYPAAIAEIHGTDDGFYGQLYSIVRDDGWVVIASIITPVDHQDDFVGELEHIIDSLEFDAELAETVFVRDIEDFDASEVDLSQSHTNDSGSLSLHYPENWEIERSEPYGEPAVAYFVVFSMPDSDLLVTVSIVDVTDDRYGLPLNQNSPYEYMYSQRHNKNGNISEYRIGDYDAVAVELNNSDTMQISFGLDNTWLAQANVKGGSVEERSQVEGEMVAILSSLEFSPIEYIETVMVLNSPIPDGWTISQQSFSNGEYYSTRIEPISQTASAPTIIVYVLNAELNDFGDYLDKNGMTAAIFDPFHITSDAETLKIDSETVTRVAVAGGPNDESKGIAHIYRPDDEWVVVIFLLSYDENELEDYVPLVENIIEASEFEVSF